MQYFSCNVADAYSIAMKLVYIIVFKFSHLPFSLLDLVTRLWTPILSMLVALMASDFVEPEQLEAMQLL